MAFGVNDTEYDKYKTPFVQIQVGDAKGKDMIPLPPSVARLLEKVEITEILEGCHHTHQISLIFREGSREPFRTDASANTNSIYSDTDITNHTGMLTDLKFTKLGKSTGLSSILPGNIGLPPSLVSVPTLGTELPSTNEVVITGTKKPIGPVQYLFEERNQIQITWGYRENLKEVRTVRTFIQIVQSAFPDNDSPTVTLTCMPISGMFDQVSPTTGVSFRTTNTIVIII